jgi:predicted dehydrogenase
MLMKKFLGRASERFPNARKYQDFRKLLDGEENRIDAVAVATPDHVHASASVMAMKMGKHCYTEKPLGHNGDEVRQASRVASRYGLATQLGNPGHSAPIFRRVVELMRAGTIGEVAEVHAWCDNEWEAPPRVAADDGPRRGRDRPQGTPPVPAHLDWDLWLGPAPSLSLISVSLIHDWLLNAPGNI